MQVQELNSSLLPWARLMAKIGHAVYIGLRAPQAPPKELMFALEVASLINSRASYSSVAAELEQHLSNARCSPLLGAAEIRLLVLCVQQDAAYELVRRDPSLPQAKVKVGKSLHRLNFPVLTSSFRPLFDLPDAPSAVPPTSSEWVPGRPVPKPWRF